MIEKNQSKTKFYSNPLTGFDYLLYVIVVVAWSFSWWPLKIQASSFVAEPVSLVWRFLASGFLMLIWCIWIQKPMRYDLKSHMRFAVLGILLFSTNFILFYLAADQLPSGLLSVVFSLASIINSILVFILFGVHPTRSLLFGAGLGFVGLGLLFWPEIVVQDYSLSVIMALGLCTAGTLSFCLGNMMSATNRKSGLPLLQMTTYGMFYGAAWSAFIAVLFGHPFVFDTSVVYISSLIFLVLVSTLAAFVAYLTLLNRIGAARAGYTTVMFPVLALIVSSLVEDYQWTLLGIVGLAMVLQGNVIVMRNR